MATGIIDNGNIDDGSFDDGSFDDGRVDDGRVEDRNAGDADAALEAETTGHSGLAYALRLWAPPGEPLGRYLLHAGAMLVIGITALSGSVKQALPPLPIDLTLASTILTVVLGLSFAVLSGRWPSSRQLTVLGLLLLMALAGAATVVPSDYGIIKVDRLFAVTLLATVGAVLPVRHHRDGYRVLLYLAGVCLVLTLWIALTGQRQFGDGGRLVTELGSTISFGRAAGFVIVVAIAWLLTSRRLTLPGVGLVLAIMMFQVWTMFAIGSRGPIQAVVMAIGAMLLLQTIRIKGRVVWRSAVALAGLTFGLWAVWDAIPINSRNRIVGFSGASADARGYAWGLAWRSLEVSPLGTGWASFSRLQEADGLTYPHNLFLEVWFEAGVVGLLALCGVLFLVYNQQRQIFRFDPVTATLAVGSVTYWLAASMVRGDVNDNKVLWIVIAAVPGSLLLSAIPARERATGNLGPTPGPLSSPATHEGSGLASAQPGQPPARSRHRYSARSAASPDAGDSQR